MLATPEYKAWLLMNRRCYDPTYRGFPSLRRVWVPRSARSGETRFCPFIETSDAGHPHGTVWFSFPAKPSRPVLADGR